MSRRIVPFLALFLAVTNAHAADLLGPGSPAPPLDVKAWFKGEKIEAFAPGKVYVIEFWATWCGPCLDAIPHITELAKKNKDVTFIGVSVWESNEGVGLQKFVDKMGDKMNYNVGWSSESVGMVTTWLTPALLGGIPATFIVKDKVIEWIGSPMSMDKPLAEIQAGTFDREAFAKSFREKAEKQRLINIRTEKLNSIRADYESGETAKAKSDLDAYEKENADDRDSVRRLRYEWLSIEDDRAWRKEVTRLLATGVEEDRMIVTSLAFRQAPKGRVAQGEFALEAAIKATQGKDISTLSYALSFYERMKNHKRGLECLEMLLTVVKALPKDQQGVWIESLAGRKKYLESLAKKAG